MERLTIRTNEASISFECESVGDIVRRLAAIEDILGDDYDLARLRELAQAEKEGRCVVLPCKVGDTVYLLEKNCVLENKVLQVSFNNSGDWVVFTDCKSLLFCKIGETAFITREAALKAREQE